MGAERRTLVVFPTFHAIISKMHEDPDEFPLHTLSVRVLLSNISNDQFHGYICVFPRDLSTISPPSPCVRAAWRLRPGKLFGRTIEPPHVQRSLFDP